MKNRNDRHNSLFSPVGRGGVAGGSGYNFQDAYVVMAITEWLSEPAFQSFIKEGFEDVDVRFEDATGAWTWHYQLKGYKVGLTEFREVIAGFARIADQPDLEPRRFILGCERLTTNLSSLWDLVREYRGARKSYAEGEVRATREEIERRLEGLGLGDWAGMIIDDVDVDAVGGGLRDSDTTVLLERFKGRFIDLPQFDAGASGILDDLFGHLVFRINRSIRVGISRDEIQDLIEEELTKARKGPASVVYLHGWARQRYEVAPDVEIDWTEHFNHSNRLMPSPEVWEAELLPELESLRARFDGDANRRRILLRSKVSLSVGLAFGRIFAEALGYSIVIYQPSPDLAKNGSEYWETGVGLEGVGQLQVDRVNGDSAHSEVVVGIGITGDIRPRVEEYLHNSGQDWGAALYVYPPGGPSSASVSDRNAGWIAGAIKDVMRTFSDVHKASLIHLFFFGPLGLAVLLGQKLNGMPDMQLYELDKTMGYAPSCRLPG